VLAGTWTMSDRAIVTMTVTDVVAVQAPAAR
jgi:hypothetical protein